MIELKVLATKENLDKVLAFIDEFLESIDCNPKTQMQVDLAVEEIFVNIAEYAYSPDVGDTTVRAELLNDGSELSITFIDSGVPYDPLAKEDPDVTLSSDEREIGGLGIFLIKKYMDSIHYEYTDCKNNLTITKNLQ